MGLHFKWHHGEAAGVGNQYNCVGVPTTLAGIVDVLSTLLVLM